MNHFPLRKLLVVVLAAFALHVPGSAARADDMDAKAKVLARLDDDWSAAAGAKDAARVGSFYAEDAIAYPPNDKAVSGRAAAEKVWATYFAIPGFSISWKTLHAAVSKSGDLGFTTGTYQDSYPGSDGKQVNETGKYVCVWKKQKGGGWKAVHDIWNSDSK